MPFRKFKETIAALVEYIRKNKDEKLTLNLFIDAVLLHIRFLES